MIDILQTQRNCKTFAILGGSGSGKTALSLEIAREFPCSILSLDSLSIYKEINIASAKPSKKERGEIAHFGIDVLFPNQIQNVQNFIKEFKKAQAFCTQQNQFLLIVGGSSFYLKALLSGISVLPKHQSATKDRIQNLGDLNAQYAFLQKIDSNFASSLKPQDSYRIMRALEIYFDADCIPSLYFKENPPKPILRECAIFEIVLDRGILRERIAYRTKAMLEQGLIDEVESLIESYGEAHQWAKSIGIKEVLAYKKGEFSLQELEAQITTHTAQLAKRQRTFNKTQFAPHFCDAFLGVKEAIKRAFG
ncbi:tRNA (adenosine(37)-N6)-dimethylallyltransferase MiaA [Helicobacter sp.]|uniref:tRNA (adenosine(37)-N6)-dimethylallyltransferase MiaA n=1 Tax=Helicobacter sp. TaxID=218 RepID=UPI0025B8EA7F|nr:tRNA (adenosine(37)-N6)-dimethylallyltransferase MiaA [Helicobacter sp.]MCI5969258.1 tRNA (adenosine(37)-N6)-dimethylallyltransferase MiaA [Helicobacter sp.]MDY2585513.1 tRNA (adenosine(37)-N6)-dimethylallyltransferase MiaA [Helicobacter sp.]